MTCLVKGFSNFDYAGDVDGRRSMTGYVFTLAGSVMFSTTESKYMAFTEATKEEIWLEGLVSDLGLHHDSVL